MNKNMSLGLGAFWKLLRIDNQLYVLDNAIEMFLKASQPYRGKIQHSTSRTPFFASSLPAANVAPPERKLE